MKTLHSKQSEPLPIIGRERALIGALANLVLGVVGKRHQTTRLHERPRGVSFDVRVLGSNYKATGHIARITVELDRVTDSTSMDGADGQGAT